MECHLPILVLFSKNWRQFFEVRWSKLKVTGSLAQSAGEIGGRNVSHVTFLQINTCTSLEKWRIRRRKMICPRLRTIWWLRSIKWLRKLSTVSGLTCHLNFRDMLACVIVTVHGAIPVAGAGQGFVTVATVTIII